VTENLKDLIERCRKRDDEAVTTLVMRFQDLAMNIANSILRDLELAQDAVQESFLTVFQKLETLREPNAFPRWLGRIVRTHALRMKKNRREISLKGKREIQSKGASPREKLEKKELHQFLHKALSTLPTRKRKTAELFYLDMRSCTEIADFFKIPKGTVKRHLYEIRMQLRGMVSGFLGRDIPTKKRHKSSSS